MTIPICFATDDNFVLYLSVAVTSIKKAGGGTDEYVIYVLYEKLTNESIDALRSLEDKHCKIELVDVSEYIFEGMYSLGHYSKAMYYRAFIPDIIRDYDKVLYLDGDILVRKPIRELYQVDLKDKCVAAALNIPDPVLKDYVENVLELNIDRYFNSGVLVINCKEFREQEIKKKFLDYIQTHDSLKMPDQDALNAILKGDIVWLGNEWNAMVNMKKEEILPEYLEKSKKSVISPAIVHYAGERKPWNCLKVPFAKEWYRMTKSKFYPGAEEYFFEKFYALTAFYFCGKIERLFRRVKVLLWKAM